MDIKVPELGESITEGTVAKWIKQVGEYVQESDVLLEIETDKVNMELNAETNGVLTEILKHEGDTVAVGDVLAVMDERQQQPPAEKQQAREKQNDEVQPKLSTANAWQLAPPSVRRKARQRGDAATRQREDAARANRPAFEKREPNTDAKIIASERTEVIPMSRRRQTIARRLVEAQQTAAMLTTFNEVDMSRVMDIRSRKKEVIRTKYDVNLGYMSFFCKAVIGALKANPYLNAEIEGDNIILKKYYDIGIAVSTDEGLVVPVIRNADSLSFAQIEQRIADLARKARENKLTLEELQGGTFTITNGGIFGSLLSTPILNAPQTGILGMHKIQRRPVAIDDRRMENRPMMYVALSYDHRLVDGKEAVSFLVQVKELLEDPESLLIEG